MAHPVLVPTGPSPDLDAQAERLKTLRGCASTTTRATGPDGMPPIELGLFAGASGRRAATISDADASLIIDSARRGAWPSVWALLWRAPSVVHRSSVHDSKALLDLAVEQGETRAVEILTRLGARPSPALLLTPASQLPGVRALLHRAGAEATDAQAAVDEAIASLAAYAARVGPSAEPFVAGLHTDLECALSLLQSPGDRQLYALLAARRQAQADERAYSPPMLPAEEAACERAYRSLSRGSPRYRSLQAKGPLQRAMTHYATGGSMGAMEECSQCISASAPTAAAPAPASASI